MDGLRPGCRTQGRYKKYRYSPQQQPPRLAAQTRGELARGDKQKKQDQHLDSLTKCKMEVEEVIELLQIDYRTLMKRQDEVKSRLRRTDARISVHLLQERITEGEMELNRRRCKGTFATKDEGALIA
ncbi:unnamed protein product [Cylicostephanus goldi]|uniref:Uncharacterized protein n=1 Tax=Cylicostephanus goldi TaxID=71465 RepID=A0A3P6QGB6_CYLGO|nr:unnamed protein product [Cylicostephanus goldi]